LSAPEHSRYADDCGAYLLGALGDRERQAFEAHLAACAECREEVDRLRPAADALPRSVTPLAAPPRLKRSLMDVVEREAGQREPARARTPLRRRLGDLVPSFAGTRPAVAWVSAAVLVAVGIAGGIGIGQLASGDDERTVSASVDRTRVPTASASLVVPDGGEDGAILRVNGLPRVKASRVYQVWVQRGDEVIAGPTFLPDARGSGAAAVPESVKDADAVMVTRERRGGAPAPSEEPILRVDI
jgi:anti-sigma factor RsiW